MNFFRKEKKKMFTKYLGEGKTIVSHGCLWLIAQELKLSTDLRGQKNDLVNVIKDKTFYYQDVHWAFSNQQENISRLHANYLLEEIANEDYKEIDEYEASLIFKNILESSDFHKNTLLNEQFIKEAKDLFDTSFSNKEYILWFDKPIRPKRSGFAGYFESWTEFIACNTESIVYLTIGED